jgi:hypothetical protein
MTEHVSWPDRLKWAEENGLKNLEEKFTTADNMSKEAQTTLTYILAGMGGTFVYILPGLERRMDLLLFGTIVLCLYFVSLGLYLARNAFFISDYPSPFQEAANLLLRPDLSLDEVRHGEVLNIGDRLKESLEWIERKARAINRVRLALILSPFVFFGGCLLFKLFG